MEALVDYDKLAAGKFTDEPKMCRRKRNSESAVKKAVQVLLDQGNIRTFSWGATIKCLSNHETIVLPKLQQMTNRTNLWLPYQLYAMNTKIACIGRTTFFNICNNITYTEEVLRLVQ